MKYLIILFLLLSINFSCSYGTDSYEQNLSFNINNKKNYSFNNSNNIIFSYVKSDSNYENELENYEKNYGYPLVMIRYSDTQKIFFLLRNDTTNDKINVIGKIDEYFDGSFKYISINSDFDYTIDSHWPDVMTNVPITDESTITFSGEFLVKRNDDTTFDLTINNGKGYFRSTLY